MTDLDLNEPTSSFSRLQIEARVRDLEAHVTALQADGTKMIDEKRELLRLIKSALSQLETGPVHGEWVIKAQKALERMR